MKKVVTYLNHDHEQYAELISVMIHIVTNSNDDEQLLLALEALDNHLSSNGEIVTVNVFSLIGDLDVSTSQTDVYFIEKSETI